MRYLPYAMKLISECEIQQLLSRIEALEKALASQTEKTTALFEQLSFFEKQYQSVLALDDTEIFKAINVNMNAK